MSKQSDRLLQQLQQYLMGNIRSSNDLAEHESPYLASLGKSANAYEDFLHGKGEAPAGYAMNLTPLAMQKQEAEMNNAPLAGGTSAAGQQPSGAYQLNYAGNQDRFAGAEAQAKEDDRTQNANQVEGILMGLGGLDQDRRTGAARNMQSLLGTYFQSANNKKPGFWSSLLKGAVGAAPGILAAL
jgi:hypothetical protein